MKNDAQFKNCVISEVRVCVFFIYTGLFSFGSKHGDLVNSKRQKKG